MKVEEKTQRTINIELNEEEATILCALLGGAKAAFKTKAGAVTYSLFSSLSDLLPNRDETFSDFFEGEVRPVK